MWVTEAPPQPPAAKQAGDKQRKPSDTEDSSAAEASSGPVVEEVKLVDLPSRRMTRSERDARRSKAARTGSTMRASDAQARRDSFGDRVASPAEDDDKPNPMLDSVRLTLKQL